MNSNKPIPMRLFSTWEVDKTTPSCIPRLCCLTLTRLVVQKALESDVQNQCIVVALKMQSTKRMLRSHEIPLPSNGLLDTELDLSFSLQYPHFLKRDCNHLQILLQRRKKYKNRTMLGYKTLAACQVNMSHVLQHSCDTELHLHQDDKDRTKPVAMVMVMSLSSQPVDHLERRQNMSADVDRSPGEISDDDELHEEGEYSSNEDTSDVDMMAGDEDGNVMMRKKSRIRTRSRVMSRQKNFKEKFVALLKRFKVTEEALESAVQDLGGDRESGVNYVADDLFEDVDNPSDSDPDMDNLSIKSTPKPKLRPFFSGKGGSNMCLDASKSNNHDDKSNEDVKKSENETNQPRRVFMDQMAAILSPDYNSPEVVVMINSQEWHGQLLAQALQSTKHRTISTCSPSEVRTVISAIINRIQKCNKNQSQDLPVKIAIVGGDSYISSILRPYVEMISGKASDWVNFIRFYIVPFGVSTIGRNLSNMDSKYGTLFSDLAWRDNIYERFDFGNRFNQSMDIGEVASRVVRYLNNAHHVVQLPLSEAILTNKDKGIDDSSHLIVPFLGEVRLGFMDFPSTNLYSSALDYEDSLNINTSLSSSPPQSSHMISHMLVSDKNKDASTPMSTHAISEVPTAPVTTATTNLDSFDLQVDYWLMINSSSAASKLDSGDQKPDTGLKLLGKKDLKCSLKTLFRSVQVFRNSGLHLSGDGLPSNQAGGLSMVVVTREKKQKIMRIGKRSKEAEGSKSQQIDGISRLICTSRSQNHPLNVTIDGVDWTGIKFFQVSSHWQTHVKYFPVLLFGDLASSSTTSI